jgi:hypothetical protein
MPKGQLGTGTLRRKPETASAPIATYAARPHTAHGMPSTTAHGLAATVSQLSPSLTAQYAW